MLNTNTYRCIANSRIAGKFFSCLLLLMVTVLVSTPVFSQRPNFVIILIDDEHEAALPPVGPSFLNYPSIQRIYQEGLMVCDAYCLQPLCNPSRNSMYTGMYPHVHGAIDNVTLPRTDLPTFYSITADHGYHNAYVGKYTNTQDKNIPGLEKTLTIKNVHQNDPTMMYNGVPKKFTGSTTVIIDDTTESWLATIDTPFIFGVGHIGTHTPIGIVDAYANDYYGMGTVPANYFRYTHDYPSFLYADGAKLAPDSFAVELNVERLYEIMSEIDRGVGNIFSVLESRGILNNTMIIFANDNGFFYGEHQLWSKGDAREPNTNVPLFIRYPAWFSAGTTVCGNMIGLNDLCPTILNAAGISSAPYHFQGQSLRYLLHPGHQRTSIYLEMIRSTIDSDSLQKPSWRAVRTTGFKYIRHRCESSVEELFDLTTDPEENSNQVNNPAYTDTLNTLRMLLDSLAVATVDTISSDTTYLPCTLIGCTASTCYADVDGDGYGNANKATFTCPAPSGYVSNGSDCNDGNAAIHPGASDVCNSVDDNCDGIIDENAIGAYVSPVGNISICRGVALILSANSGPGITYQWLKNGGSISGASAQTYAPTKPASYSVSESNSFGCNSVSAAASVTVLSSPAPTITPLGNLDICSTGSVVLHANSGAGYLYQWEKETDLLSGKTNQNYTATVQGNYKVIISGSNGCSKTSKGTKVTNSCKEDLTAGISSPALLALYPNPTDGKFVIDLQLGDDENSKAMVNVINMIGQVVYDETLPVSNGVLRQEIQLKNSTDEMYLVKVIVNDRVYVQQLMVHKE